jgi:hypothetical protein
LPDTIEALIRSRIDVLSPPQQLTLKINSVLGIKFSMEDVQAIYPAELQETAGIVTCILFIDVMKIYKQISSS